jgi:lipopolysaccharide export system permease protein
MTLGLYFSRRFLVFFGLIVALVAGLMILIEMVELIRSNAGTALNALQALELAAFKTPRNIYAMLPLLVLMGAVWLFLALARSSELVVTRASGRSALRAAMAPATAALLLGAVVVAMVNPLVVATSRLYESGLAAATTGPERLLQVSDQALWLRQASDDGQILIRAGRATEGGTVLHGVTFFAFDADGEPNTRIEAAGAVLGEGRWLLEDAKQWRLTDPNPERSAALLLGTELATDLTADKIRNSFTAPEQISVWHLPEFIRSLERAGFSSLGHRVWLQVELTQPLMFAAMVLLAAVFTMRRTRTTRAGAMVLLALLAGFSAYVLRNFARLLGEQGQIPVVLAAWAVPVATLMLAVGVLLYLEDG